MMLDNTITTEEAKRLADEVVSSLPARVQDDGTIVDQTKYHALIHGIDAFEIRDALLNLAVDRDNQRRAADDLTHLLSDITRRRDEAERAVRMLREDLKRVVEAGQQVQRTGDPELGPIHILSREATLACAALERTKQYGP